MKKLYNKFKALCAAIWNKATEKWGWIESACDGVKCRGVCGCIGAIVLSVIIIVGKILFGVPSKKIKLEQEQLNALKDRYEERATIEIPTRGSVLFNIYQMWDAEWKRLPEFGGKNDPFYPLFASVYADVKKKSEQNKKNNFKWKRIFVIFLVSGPVAALLIKLISWVLTLFNLQNTLSHSAFQSFEIAAIWLFLAFMIQKWLNVKKYQETWARHADHCLALEQEMLKFVYGIDGYEKEDTKRRIFIERCLEIWKENQKKFSDNMNNKEFVLMNSLSEFKINK